MGISNIFMNGTFPVGNRRKIIYAHKLVCNHFTIFLGSWMLKFVQLKRNLNNWCEYSSHALWVETQEQSFKWDYTLSDNSLREEDLHTSDLDIESATVAKRPKQEVTKKAHGNAMKLGMFIRTRR